MATKKDLVEAHAFSRRRLVTAFVSGAPGGREVEPARPGRMVVGGAALAVLLVAGAAIAGALKDRPSEGWDQPGSLVTDDHGALYVVLEDQDARGQAALRPVINVTSAQLILNSTTEAEGVPSEDIARKKKGSPIGILGAPATVPPADHLVNSGWTACTGDGLGVKVEVAHRPHVTPAPGIGFVVRGAGSKDYYLLAEAPAADGIPARAYRYPVPAGGDEQVYLALGVSTPSQAPTVPDDWLELFPEGGALDSSGLRIAGWGHPVAAATRSRYGFPKDARYGDYFLSSGKVVAVTKADPAFVELSPFAAAVLQNTSLGKRKPRELPTPSSGVTYGTQGYRDSHWPQQVLTSAPDGAQACGVLETAEGEEPAVRLATAPEGAASAEGVATGRKEVSVESGYGALVHSADWISDRGGTVHLVDDRGYSYPVAGEDEVARLGYGSVAEVVVPHQWNKLFSDGPELSREDALCPPAASDQRKQQRTCS